MSNDNELTFLTETAPNYHPPFEIPREILLKEAGNFQKCTSQGDLVAEVRRVADKIYLQLRQKPTFLDQALTRRNVLRSAWRQMKITDEQFENARDDNTL